MQCSAQMSYTKARRARNVQWEQGTVGENKYSLGGCVGTPTTRTVKQDSAYQKDVRQRLYTEINKTYLNNVTTSGIKTGGEGHPHRKGLLRRNSVEHTKGNPKRGLHFLQTL